MRDLFENPANIGVLAAAILLLASLANAQQTLHIPADRPTIQAAIDDAAPGDTLLVAPGTYLENLDFHGKAITLQSAEGPATTILDGRRLAPTVSFLNGETRAATLSGFTIRNGAPAPATQDRPAPHGAGILLDAASPTLSGNILTDNLCAAIDAAGSAPLLHDNRITRTHADPVCVAQAVAPIVFTGAASSSTLVPTLLHNTIEANDLTGSPIQPNAGAIALLAAPALLQGNILRANIVPGDAPAAIQILANPTPDGANPILIEQNLIVANSTHCGAGGIAVSILNAQGTIPHLELQIVNNTIADNLFDDACPAQSQPAEVILTPGYLPSQILLANNIFAARTTHTALQCSEPLPARMFHHNLLHSPQATTACPDSGANLQEDPRFQNRAEADYHLALQSPAVDAGSNTAAPLPTQDLDRTPRLQNATDQPTAIVDFGAYEHPAPHLVTPTTTVLDATISPSEAFQTVTLTTHVTTTAEIAPTGSVTLTASAPGLPSITLATMPLDVAGRAAYTTSSLTAGAWTLLATYTGADTLATSASAPMLLTVHPATTVLAFDITPSATALGQAVVASASLTAPLSTHIPAGSIQFFDLAPKTPVLLGTPTLDARGHARMTLPALAAGTHRIMAVYSGAQDFTPSDIPPRDALILNVGASDFSVTPAAANLTVQTLHHAPDTMALASLGAFADSVTFSCANLPLYATCSFAPATATLTPGAKADMVLTVETSTLANFYARTTPPQSGLAPITLAAAFPLSVLTLLGLHRKSRVNLLFAALLPILLLTGCGAGKLPDHTAPGTYRFDVVARATATGISHTTQITLMVTP